jgi:hypothetical protein
MWFLGPQVQCSLLSFPTLPSEGCIFVLLSIHFVLINLLLLKSPLCPFLNSFYIETKNFLASESGNKRRKDFFSHYFRVFSPWSLGPIVVGLWWGRTSWWRVHGRVKLLISWQEADWESFYNKAPPPKCIKLWMLKWINPLMLLGPL